MGIKQPATKSFTGRHDNHLLLLFEDVAQTTWRMFLPVLGFAMIGFYLDKAVMYFPYATLVGLVIGSCVSALLIKRLLQKI